MCMQVNMPCVTVCMQVNMPCVTMWPSLGQFHNQLSTRLIVHSWWAMFKFVSTHQDTPLHLAAEEGHAGTAQVLVEKGADINIKNSRGVRE